MTQVLELSRVDLVVSASESLTMGSKGGVQLTTLTNEHLLPLHLLCHGLDTSLTEGMARKRVKELLKESGKNKFCRPAHSVPEKLKSLFSSRSSSTACKPPSRWDSMSSVASSSSGDSVGSCRSRGSRIYRPSAARPRSMAFDSNRWSGSSFGSRLSVGSQSSVSSGSRWDSMTSLASSSSGKSRRSRSSWGSMTSLTSVGSVSSTNSTSSSKAAFSRSEWKKLFGNRIPENVTVIRDGQQQITHGKNLVIGDVVQLRSGDSVPADCRIIDSDDVIVDNRLITGMRRERRTHEIDEVYSTPDLLVSPNMLFACTKILKGHCTAMVLRTGEETVFGTLKDYAVRVKFTVSRTSSKEMSAPKHIEQI